jgi:hypothetical protein
MDNLQAIIDSKLHVKHELLAALKILVDEQVFTLLARANANQLLDQRMDSEDEVALAKEIREHRQTNRILLGFEATARELTKGNDNE